MFPIKRVGNKSYNVKVYIFLNYAYRLAKHSYKDHVDMQGDTSFHLRYCCDDLGIVDCRTINNEAILNIHFKELREGKWNYFWKTITQMGHFLYD